jgi:hypothetical protein
MNYWLKTSICFLILLFSQSQAGLAVEEINQPIQMAVGPVPDGGDQSLAYQTAFAI